MKIKKLFLLGLVLFLLVGCTNVKELEYDDIINTLSLKEKSANTYKKGYKFYVPYGVKIDDGGANYSVLTSSDITYYLYVDLIGYANKNENIYEIDKSALYSEKISYDKKTGYVEINLWKNEQYLIEIMYNYAKIEVMVDESLVNKALVNSVSILKSIKYNDFVILELLNNDDLDYTEENYELFDEDKSNSNILDYIEDTDKSEDEEIKDTDFIN